MGSVIENLPALRQWLEKNRKDVEEKKLPSATGDLSPVPLDVFENDDWKFRVAPLVSSLDPTDQARIKRIQASLEKIKAWDGTSTASRPKNTKDGYLQNDEFGEYAEHAKQVTDSDAHPDFWKYFSVFKRDTQWISQLIQVAAPPKIKGEQLNKLSRVLSAYAQGMPPSAKAQVKVLSLGEFPFLIGRQDPKENKTLEKAQDKLAQNPADLNANEKALLKKTFRSLIQNPALLNARRINMILRVLAGSSPSEERNPSSPSQPSKEAALSEDEKQHFMALLDELFQKAAQDSCLQENLLQILYPDLLYRALRHQLTPAELRAMIPLLRVQEFQASDITIEAVEEEPQAPFTQKEQQILFQKLDEAAAKGGTVLFGMKLVSKSEADSLEESLLYSPVADDCFEWKNQTEQTPLAKSVEEVCASTYNQIIGGKTELDTQYLSVETLKTKIRQWDLSPENFRELHQWLQNQLGFLDKAYLGCNSSPACEYINNFPLDFANRPFENIKQLFEFSILGTMLDNALFNAALKKKCTDMSKRELDKITESFKKDQAAALDKKIAKAIEKAIQASGKFKYPKKAFHALWSKWLSFKRTFTRSLPYKKAQEYVSSQLSRYSGAHPLSLPFKAFQAANKSKSLWIQALHNKAVHLVLMQAGFEAKGYALGKIDHAMETQSEALDTLLNSAGDVGLLWVFHALSDLKKPSIEKYLEALPGDLCAERRDRFRSPYRGHPYQDPTPVPTPVTQRAPVFVDLQLVQLREIIATTLLPALSKMILAEVARTAPAKLAQVQIVLKNFQNNFMAMGSLIASELVKLPPSEQQALLTGALSLLKASGPATHNLVRLLHLEKGWEELNVAKVLGSLALTAVNTLEMAEWINENPGKTAGLVIGGTVLAVLIAVVCATGVGEIAAAVVSAALGIAGAGAAALKTLLISLGLEESAAATAAAALAFLRTPLGQKLMQMSPLPLQAR